MDASQQVAFIDDFSFSSADPAAAPSSPADPAAFPNLVEQCTCAPGYTGLSCERCAAGFTRQTPNAAPSVACMPCQCSGKSTTCDGATGVCSACEGNSTGAHCELCLAGFYRTAQGDCELCPSACNGRCSAISRPVVWGSTMLTQAATGFVDGVKCDACTADRDGEACEVCADGYFGDPNVDVLRCRPCDCSGECGLHSRCSLCRSCCQLLF